MSSWSSGIESNAGYLARHDIHWTLRATIFFLFQTNVFDADDVEVGSEPDSAGSDHGGDDEEELESGEDEDGVEDEDSDDDDAGDQMEEEGEAELLSDDGGEPADLDDEQIADDDEERPNADSEPGTDDEVSFKWTFDVIFES